MAQPLHRISKIELVSFRQIRALLDMFTMLLSPLFPLFFSPSHSLGVPLLLLLFGSSLTAHAIVFIAVIN